ncbi:hypothetical protein BGZ74_001737, partial [Mortierella antarctica]
QELAIILNGVQHHHTTHPVDPNAVETNQRKRLGAFFKRTLPYKESAQDISLVMLALELELDKHARTSAGETLRSIVKGDIGKSSDFRVVAMVAPSGSGKTATAIDLANKHFVVYFFCSIPASTVSVDFTDPNFVRLANDVEDMYRTVIRQPRMSLDPLEIDYEVKKRAMERVSLEILARLLFLQLLFKHDQGLEPRQFFREQTSSGGAFTIAALVSRLRAYDNDTIQCWLMAVQTKLRSHLGDERGMVIAVDEAQLAVTSILNDKLISPSAVARNRQALFDSRSQVRPEFRRGFLTPLTASLSKVQATLVILGTSLTLQDADMVYSAVGKPTNFTRITDFPQLDDSGVTKMVSDLVEMSGCEIPPTKRRKLSGRVRFSVGIVHQLATTDSTQGTKQTTLDKAIDHTIERVKSQLRDEVRRVLVADMTGENARLLCRMVLAYRLHGSKISFATSKTSDFVDKSLCRLQLQPDDVHLIMDEPLVAEAVEEELKASNKDPTYVEHLDQLYRIVANLGASSATKGASLEMLIRRSLQRFNGVVLKDLPFLQVRDLNLPGWCHRHQLQIDEINTANGFGYKDSGVAADLAFLTDCPPNKMLVAQSGTRPDGVWFFPGKQYAGSLAIKFYSDSVPKNKNDSNTTSSDVRACFLQADGTTMNQSLAATRRAYEDAGTPSNLKGILRIHVVLPRVKGGTPITHVKKDPTTGIEDVMVYIDISNMDSFFDENIEAYKDEVVRLKRLISYVSAL